MQSTLEVKPGAEARVDWLVAVTAAGEARLKVESRGEKYADAMEKSYTVYEHGIEKFVSRSGKMRSDSVAINWTFLERGGRNNHADGPGGAQHGHHHARPLPYLIDYPYAVPNKR